MYSRAISRVLCSDNKHSRFGQQQLWKKRLVCIQSYIQSYSRTLRYRRCKNNRSNTPRAERLTGVCWQSHSGCIPWILSPLNNHNLALTRHPALNSVTCVDATRNVLFPHHPVSSSLRELDLTCVFSDGLSAWPHMLMICNPNFESTSMVIDLMTQPREFEWIDGARGMKILS
jgi:hypothetical protein